MRNLSFTPPKDFQPIPMKALFKRNGFLADLLETYSLRETEIEVITKMLACGTPLLGSREFCCENPDCRHSRIICQSCKGRCCPVCGKKATEMWIATMMASLHNTPCQHGTFTMLDSLWSLFEVNCWLLGALFALAADNLLYAAQKRSLTIGIFGALHTYGRQLNWNCHIHLSWTTVGINAHGNWKVMSFDLPKVRSRWMWNVRQFILEAWDSLTMPPSLAHLRDYDEWKRFVLSQGKNEKGEDYWHVYFARPTKHAQQTAKYLGRYLKKPLIADSRLADYDGGSPATLRVLNHRTEHYDTLELSQRELILRLIKHIPEKYFRMICYFGFLANRVVGEKLPLVRKALGQEDAPQVRKLTFAGLSHTMLNTDPFSCILCGGKMVYRKVLAAVKLNELVANVVPIARMRYVV